MATLSKPHDIARETLKLLSAQKITPTPDNYQRVYNEIAGVKPVELQTVLEKSLKNIISNLPASQNSLEQTIRSFERALIEKDWSEFERQLSRLIINTGQPNKNEDWADLIRELIKQWDIKQPGLTSTRKREAMERVLINFSHEDLHNKLQALVKSWSERSSNTANVDATEPATVTNDSSTTTILPSEKIVGGFQALLVQTLEKGVAARLQSYPDLFEEARELVTIASVATDTSSWQELEQSLKRFWLKLEIRGVNENQLLEGVLKLLRLLINNISELLDEDQWLRGQLTMLQDIVSRPPEPHLIENAERRFKEIIFKQGTLKHSLNEAKEKLKIMVSEFIERLGEMSQSTGKYQSKVERYVDKLRETDDISSIQDIIHHLLSDTKGLQIDIVRSRDELIEARRQVELSQEKIRELETELDLLSEQVREDELTGMLNRRGLDDALEREVAIAERQKTPLSMALLDIDNFKVLNDAYGHQVGDDVLIHLTQIIKTIMRPSDVVARYGGEEFLIILPNTSTDEAKAVMARLQRELTKRFFLHNNERILITFSAGIALYNSGEPQTATIKRADKAMYEAKHQGKNRVLISN